MDLVLLSVSTDTLNRLQKGKKRSQTIQNYRPVGVTYLTGTANWRFITMLMIVWQTVASILPAVSLFEVILLVNQ